MRLTVTHLVIKQLLTRIVKRYHDAERDCTSALALPKGKNNIKALYRRGLARKGMRKVEGALSGSYYQLTNERR